MSTAGESIALREWIWRTQQLFGQVASVLFNFAVDNDYAETNPASRMNCVGRPRAWTDVKCGAFEANAGLIAVEAERD